MHSHGSLEYIDVLRLPEVGRTIIGHLTTNLDKLNFSLAIRDFGEMVCWLRKDNIRRYSQTENGQYENKILSLLTMFDDRLIQTFNTFDYLEQARAYVILPNTDIKAFFGMDIDRRQDESIKWSCGVQFVVDINLRRDLRNKPKRVRRSLIGRIYDFLYDGIRTDNVSLRAVTTNQNSIFSSKLAPASKLCYKNNECVLTKIVARELLRAEEPENWSVMFVFPKKCFLYTRFSDAKPVERNMNAPTKLFNFSHSTTDCENNIRINLLDLQLSVPPCMKRKRFTRLNRNKIPLRHRDIVAFYAMFDFMINMTRPYWSSFFYKPLILMYGREEFEMPEDIDWMDLYHIRFASDDTIVLSKDIMFAELPKFCKQKLVSIDRNILDCDAVGTRLFLHSLNRYVQSCQFANPDSETIELPQSVMYSYRHICSHHPIVDPFLPPKNCSSSPTCSQFL